MSFEDRSNALIELLDQLENRGIRYVLIGGYVVTSDVLKMTFKT